MQKPRILTTLNSKQALSKVYQRQGRTIESVAQELNLAKSTLKGWMAAANPAVEFHICEQLRARYTRIHLASQGLAIERLRALKRPGFNVIRSLKPVSYLASCG